MTANRLFNFFVDVRSFNVQAHVVIGHKPFIALVAHRGFTPALVLAGTHGPDELRAEVHPLRGGEIEEIAAP